MKTTVGGGYATELTQQSALTQLSLIASGIGSKDCVRTVLNEYGANPVTTAAWVELIASTANDISSAQIFDSSGEILEVGVGALGAEVRKFLVTPGGNGNLAGCIIPSGSRVSIKAVSGNATTSGTYLAVNFFG